MSATIFINGTERTADITAESIRIRREATHKSGMASFIMRALSTIPEENQLVEIYESSVLKFAGIISEYQDDSPLPERSARVDVMDWFHSLRGELIRTSYEGRTLLYIIQDIVRTRVLDDDLKLMLRFEEGAGTDCQDDTQYDNDATIQGSGHTWDTTNYAVDLDGSSGSFITVEDTSDLDFANNFSLCIQFTMDRLGETLLAKDNSSALSYPPYRIVVKSSGEVEFMVCPDSSTQSTLTTTTAPITVSTDHTVVCTYNKTDGVGKIYVDGAIVKSGAMTTGGAANTSDRFVIGAGSETESAAIFDVMGIEGISHKSAQASPANPIFDGKVNRVSLYSKVLTAIESRRWHLDCLEVKVASRLISSSTVPIDNAAFDYTHATDGFSKLARALGLAWNIDQQMFLSFYDLGGETSSATMDEDSGNRVIQGSMIVEKDVTQIRNRVFVRGGTYPGTWAHEVLEGDGATTIFPLPYKYDGFEMFTDTSSLCGDLISWFRMNESTGNPADLQSGTNTLTGANLAYHQTGKINQAIGFDGATSSARKTGATHVTGNSAHSLFAWVNPDVHDTTERVVVGIGDFSNGHSRISLIKISTTYYVRHTDGVTTTDTDVGDLSGAFHHVGFSYDPDVGDGNRLKIYVDGIVKSTQDLTTAQSIDAGVFEVGGDNGSNVFDGDIDEVCYFDYALSTQEQQAIFFVNDTSSLSVALLHSGIDFLDTSGFDAYYNYSEKNYKFSTAPSDGVLLYSTGQPQLPIHVTASNTESQTKYGKRELSIRDQSIDNLILGRSLAAAEVARRKDPVVNITFETYVTGIDPGETITIVAPLHGIDTLDFFVKKVETIYELPVLSGSVLHKYRVTCSNVLSKDWLDFLRDSFVSGLRTLNPNEGEAVADITSHAEDLGVADAYTIATPVDHTEAIDVADAHTENLVASGSWVFSNDAGTTTDKARFSLADFG
tara:strand:+ start:4983 stop:7829 length:2847 start_codon:yes stop_codon:yes gene_type:complete